MELLQTFFFSSMAAAGGLIPSLFWAKKEGTESRLRHIYLWHKHKQRASSDNVIRAHNNIQRAVQEAQQKWVHRFDILVLVEFITSS